MSQATKNVRKLRDTVDVVADFGAVGDGVTDDTTAIQNAINTRKTVVFPKPSAYYKTTAALSVFYNSHLTGEEGVTTTVRRTSGTGSVFDFLGSNENAVIENLRVGGSGCVGITVAGGGYANYLSTLTLRNVHFENDLLSGVNANLIHCDFTDCTFGYFVQTAAHALFQAVVSSFSGGSNTNVNTLTNCKFFNGGTTVAAVSFTGGLVLTFNNCAWENNGRDLLTSNVQNCVLNNCYSERGKHATSQFDFGASRVRSKVLGGQFNGASMPAAASMFRAPLAGALLVEDADISTTASAFTYQKADDSSHTPPVTGVHHFRNNRIQGNASDPLLWMDNLLEAVPIAWTPVPTNMAVVNGTGGVTYAGYYRIIGRECFFTIKVITSGTATSAATANSTFFAPIANLPLPVQSSTAGVSDENLSGTSLGVGLAYSGNGRIYMPTWGARNGNIAISGSFLF